MSSVDSRSFVVRGIRAVALVALALSFTFRARAQEHANQLPPRVNPAAKKFLDQTLQALGGDAFLRFKTLTTTGRVYLIEEGATAALFPFVSEQQFPDKRRFSYGKDKPVILINNGDKAIELDRMGVTNQTPQQVHNWAITSRYGIENLLRVRIQEPGVLVQDGGVDFVDNLPAHVLEIFDANNVRVKLYLQEQTHLPIQITYRALNSDTGRWEEFTDQYSDYRPFQGIETPMHIARLIDGERVSEVFRNTAKYDEQYPTDAFEVSQ
jgi:hypothetical protein